MKIPEDSSVKRKPEMKKLFTRLKKLITTDFSVTRPLKNNSPLSGLQMISVNHT